jgi:hypothetical protein
MDIVYNEELDCFEDATQVYLDIEAIFDAHEEYFEGKDVAYLRKVWSEQIPMRIFDLLGVCYWEFENNSQ